MTDEENEESKEYDRITISTIHRVKGLEWKDVYVPYFNERYMPCSFREDKDNDKRPVRHLRGCRARVSNTNADCDRQCAEYFAGLAKQQRGLTPEEIQLDEERRLAHVAATRAKDRLVFLATEKSNLGDNCTTSSFLGCLRDLPHSVFQEEKTDLERMFEDTQPVEGL